MTEPIELIRNIHGEPMLTSDALALLFGVTPEDIVAHSTDPSTDFPNAWIRAGRRRSREAQAATGKDDILAVLAYWARKDRDMVITVEDGDQ
uniref:Uncharacterized protein n=2 Tax=unclassified Mycobacterium TaxID=2642494 RepID=A0A5Q5BKV4_MYCSS